ncbi:MAG: hypothetical protein NWE98_00020 [Candidatus Bathyarchaeota archaeon]|nr:hypothetical protein [Candidatus Bathyarchaeota archaeon]
MATAFTNHVKEAPSGLVKIQTKTITKRYGRSKNTYHYKQHLLPFPVKENENLKPFLKKELQFKMNATNDTLNVTLTKQKENTKGNTT